VSLQLAVAVAVLLTLGISEETALVAAAAAGVAGVVACAPVLVHFYRRMRST